MYDTDSSDKIIVEDLEVYAYHGVFEEEKRLGQKFLLTLELDVPLQRAGKNDDLTASIHYGELSQLVAKAFCEESTDLIETAAEKTAALILKTYPLAQGVKVTLKKPWAPIGLPVEHAAISVTRKWHKVYVAVGSNMGDKKAHIQQGKELLSEDPYVRFINSSKLYVTEPWGYTDQEEFMNCVWGIETIYEPDLLMERLLEIERMEKRERVIKWGPRTLDLDILLYDDQVITTEKVIVPHPRMEERMFVLEPLAEIAPYALHPLSGKRIFRLKEELEKCEGLKVKE